MRSYIIGFILLAAIIGGAFEYRDLTTLTVSELNQRATELDGQTVTVEGTVAHNAGVMGLGGFVITDGPSTILVITNGGIPEYGSQIDVTGTFRKAVSLNNLEYNIVYTKRDSI